jgi:hypothetical protein
MSFTRFRDDPYRIQKQVDESSFVGRYMLNTPGQGINLPFLEDPQIRLQKWGANLHTNPVNLESDLLGLTRKYNRDLPSINQYQNHSIKSKQNTYSTTQSSVNESRTSHPAWTYKDLEQNRWETPKLNPLNGIEPEFKTNIQTRIIEKDSFVAKMPVISNMNY